MANNPKISQFLFLCVPLLAPIFGCQNGASADSSSENQPRQTLQSEQKVPTLPMNNGIVIFIDKTSSLQDVAAEESQRGSKWLFNQIKPVISSSGGKVTIYFIHKSLESASPFFEDDFAIPDTRDMTTFPARRAVELFAHRIDSILYSKIKEAVETPIKKDPGEETDLFVSLKKANDRFTGLPSVGKKMILYYSDMIESVKDVKCGKDYQKIYFKTVPEADETGRKDAIPIRKCFGLDKLPQNTAVSLFIPTGSLELNKHRHIPDYWRALFGEFGVKELVSNL